MTITEHLNSDFAARKSSGVVFPPVREMMTERRERGAVAFRGSLWIKFVFPVGKENGSCQTTEVVSPGEPGEFVPRTALGRKLASLRRRAVASGMRLLSEDEVLEEVRRRRGELENDEADLC
jgi:hypothetical protein